MLWKASDPGCCCCAQTLTSFDYLELISLCCGSSAVCHSLAQYICEVSLLQSDLGDYPQALVAAAAVLLARLTNGEGLCERVSKSTDFMWCVEKNSSVGPF